MGIGDGLSEAGAQNERIPRPDGEASASAPRPSESSPRDGAPAPLASGVVAQAPRRSKALVAKSAAWRRAVFLDRDGVLNAATLDVNGTPHPPASVAELTLLPGVAGACARLKAAGFLLVVVTNQPDVARGTQRRATVEAINAALRARLPLDDLRVCYHDDADRCACRKPLPGLLIEAARDWGIACAASFLVGDRWRDIGAGRAAGCRTVLVDHGYAEGQREPPDARVCSLSEAAAWILTPHGMANDTNRPYPQV